MLYQGEDIAIRIGGDSKVDLANNDFVVYVYPSGGGDGMVYSKDELEYEDGIYMLVIPHATTIDMLGTYGIEVMAVIDSDRRSIYCKDNAFTVNRARIGHMNIEI